MSTRSGHDRSYPALHASWHAGCAGRTAPGRCRVGDADRYHTIDRLAQAYTAGMLTGAEYRQRTAAAGAAVTADDLTPLTADLPGPGDDQFPVPEPVELSGRQVLVHLSVVWACLSVLSITIWALICLLGHRIAYPGFAWVIAPAGSVLAVLWICYGHRPAGG